MDLTQGTKEEKNIRAKKMMLWFGIASLVMSFSGLISAVIISSSRPDWLDQIEIPNAFIVSTVVIIISSITFLLAKHFLRKNNQQLATLWLVVTFVLGLFFIWNQFSGFEEIINAGYNFTGPTSNVTMSYVFLIAVIHIAHLAVGLICLLVVIYNHFKQKYNATNMLGIELAETYWHFVDILWLGLFLFLNYMI